MTVLVAAASEHGATAEIAVWIGACLAANGVDVDVRRLDEVDDVARYDAFVLGSAVYLGQWLKTARSFIDDHAGKLASGPTWLFSSGPIVGDPPPPDDPAAMRAGLVERLVETTHARDHKLFGGKLEKGNLTWCEKIAVRCAHASEGDHRDRAAVDEWAAKIARELEQLAPQSRRIPTRIGSRRRSEGRRDANNVARCRIEGRLADRRGAGRLHGTSEQAVR